MKYGVSDMLRRARWMVLGLLALPAAEILVFIAVAMQIGFITTVALSLVMSLAGVSLLRGARIAHIRGRPIPGAFGGGAGAAHRILAGLLLIVPGFLTDIAGLVLLLPAIRRWLHTAIASSRRDGAPASTNRVLDLDPVEWKRLREDDVRGERRAGPR